MELSSKTDKGKIRAINEDAFLVIPPWSKQAISKQTCAFLVADGMGGHKAGEVASQMAVSLTEEWFNKNNLKDISTDLVEDLTNFINEQIWDYSQKHKETEGMGTTYSIILIKNNKAIIGHIGDSRIYRLRNNELTQLTKDHSIIGEQLRLGKITIEQARVHPARGILSKVLGARQFIKADVFETEIKQNDEFILLTDGIYSMMDNQEISSLIKKVPPAKLSETLIKHANDYGGNDNSTTIAFKLNEIPFTFPSIFSFKRIVSLISNFFSNNC